MHTITKNTLFIEDCFRNIADRDYISSRSNYQIGLMDQFLWAALQSIEKYLKAILLYFNKNTKTINHDLIKAITLVESIPSIGWDFTDTQKKFLEFLSKCGADRYFGSPRSMVGDELLKLDNTVWNIRKYCQDIPFLQENEKDFDQYMSFIKSKECIKKANKFRLIQHGYLEMILDSGRFVKQWKILTWKNFYYGRNKKHNIKFNKKMFGQTPAHYVFPEIYPWVKDHVKLSPDTIKDFEAHKDHIEGA